MKIKKIYTVRQFRKNPTKSEAMIWGELRRKKFLGLKFRRQHPLAGFILDFYCPALKLGIEIDGRVHVNPTAQEYDLARSHIIKEHGIILIRIKAEAIENNLARILKKIKLIINQLPSPRGSVERGRGQGESMID